MVCLLNSCLHVMLRSCFESLASVVTIKLVHAAHCDVPRRALRCATHYGTPYVHGQLWVKNDWQFYNPRIDTDQQKLFIHKPVIRLKQNVMTHFYSLLSYADIDVVLFGKLRNNIQPHGAFTYEIPVLRIRYNKILGESHAEIVIERRSKAPTCMRVSAGP